MTQVLCAKIVDNKQVAEGVYSMTVPVPHQPKAGQFYMLRSPAGQVLLPRAISVCDWKDGMLRLLYQVVGKGTEGFARMGPGDPLELNGPLGNGFPLDKLSGRVALVGGGIGVAPLHYTARMLRKQNVETSFLAGFRDEPFLLEELRQLCDDVQVATQTGREGHKGLVTGLLHPEAYDAVLTCGPTPMMQAVTVLCTQAGVPVYVSLENRMACGVGACLVCTCADRDGNSRRTCKAGPVFRGEEIDFGA